MPLPAAVTPDSNWFFKLDQSWCSITYAATNAAASQVSAVLRRQQEGVVHIVRVSVVSDDLPRSVDGVGGSALASTLPRARGIDRRNLAIGSAQETVRHPGRVNVASHNLPRRV